MHSVKPLSDISLGAKSSAKNWFGYKIENVRDRLGKENHYKLSGIHVVSRYAFINNNVSPLAICPLRNPLEFNWVNKNKSMWNGNTSWCTQIYVSAHLYISRSLLHEKHDKFQKRGMKHVVCSTTKHCKVNGYCIKHQCLCKTLGAEFRLFRNENLGPFKNSL